MSIRVSFRFVYLALIMVLHFSLTSTGQIKHASQELPVGDLKVRMLQDAQIYLPLSSLVGIEYDDAKKIVGGSDSVLTPVNSFLVQTPNHFVLVDAGLGIYPGEDSGHLLEHLKDAGVDPAKVDLILITHFHFDHIGGLVSSEGKPLFPNAVVRASQTESDFWMRDSSLIPLNLRARAANIKAKLSPYISAKLFKPFSPDEELGDGIKAIPANGHTIGHTVYSFSSNGIEFWCIGDLIHFGTVQFKHPSVSYAYDLNSPMAVASRIEFFQRAAESHTILAATHLPEMVWIEKDKDAFITKPVDNH